MAHEEGHLFSVTEYRGKFAMSKQKRRRPVNQLPEEEMVDQSPSLEELAAAALDDLSSAEESSLPDPNSSVQPIPDWFRRAYESI